MQNYTLEFRLNVNRIIFFHNFTAQKKLSLGLNQFLKMISKKRRLIIIIISVTLGSLISLYIVKKRMGTLNQQDYMQLGFNFLFAIAIVIGIGLLFQKMNKDDLKK